MSKINVNIRMDSDLKEQVEVVLHELGLNMTTAINVFAHAIVRQKGMPFEVSLTMSNIETRAAMQEIEDMRSGRLPKQQQSVESLFKELEISVDS